MKVYIGPYGKWINSYKVFEFLEKYMSEDRFDKLCDFIQPVFNHTINKFRDRRTIKVKIHSYDTWSMDTTLSHIIVPMLIQLKETGHGSPYVDDIDVPDHLKSTAAPPKKNDWDVDDNHHLRWQYVLDEMIWAFTQIRDDRPDEDLFMTAGEIDFEKSDKSSTSVLIWKKEPKIDKEKYKEYHSRIQNGTMLFGKYFTGLWD